MLMRHNMFGRCSAQAPRPHEACCVIHFEIVENGEGDSQFQVEDKKAKTSGKKNILEPKVGDSGFGAKDTTIDSYYTSVLKRRKKSTRRGRSER